MASEGGGDAVRSIGARLRTAREKRGLTLLQAAEKLHVDPHTLEALEAQDFGSLGADVYVRGHLRRYAEVVGESPLELQELYAGGKRAAPPDLTRIPRSEPVQRSSPLMLLAVLLVVGSALVGAVWWLVTLPGAKPQPLMSGAPTSAPTAASAGGAAATPDTAVPEATSAPGTDSQASATGTPAGVATAGTGQAQPARLGLRFSAASWVEVTDASGRRLLEGLIEAGSARELAGKPPLRVVLGNAAAAAVQLNGHPVSFPGLVHHDGSAHLLIDESGRASAAAPRLAHED
jgi:cytoskeleton protein RodZ